MKRVVQVGRERGATRLQKRTGWSGGISYNDQR